MPTTESVSERVDEERAAQALYSKHKGWLSRMLREAFEAGQHRSHAPTEEVFQPWLRGVRDDA